MWNWFVGKDADGWQWTDGSTGGTVTPGPGAPAGAIAISPVPTHANVDEPLTIRVILADTSGTAVADEEVTLTLSGVTATTPDPDDTDANGVVTFTVTPTTSGYLRVTASTADVTSAQITVQVLPPPPAMPVVAKRRAKKASQAVAPLSWKSIGPAGSLPTPAQPMLSAPMQAPPTPGMQQFAARLESAMRDQQAKLQADIARVQSFLK